MGVAAERDRFVDLLRGVSIVAVVVGHWLVAGMDWGDAGLAESSTLAAVPSMWPLTWLFQVIPVFFFVGGYANKHSWESVRRRGEGYAAFVDRRVHRMVRPTGVLLAVLAVVALVVAASGAHLRLGSVSGILLQPLWFLGVYLAVIALTPLTLALHRRWGWQVLPVLAALALLTDVGRIGLGIESVGNLNVLFVWALVHQLGYLYADGLLGQRVGVGLAAAGLAAVSLLVALGPYPARMVGVPGDRVANMHPPTVAVLALGVAQVGVAILLRPMLLRWLDRPRVWVAVVFTNLSIMTAYVWHQPVLIAVSRAALPAGFPQPDPGTPSWWASRVLWLALLAGVLAVVVVALRRAEQVPPPPAAPATRMGTITAALAVLLLFLGFLALAATDALHPLEARAVLGGLAASAIAGLLLVVGATALLTGTRRGRGPTLAGLVLVAVLLAATSAAYAAGWGALPASRPLAALLAVLAAVLGLTAGLVARWGERALAPGPG